MFPSKTIAWYTAKMFLIRTLAFLGGLVLILETLDLLGESSRILAAAGNGDAELWHYVALRVPQLIQLFLPFSVLLGTLVTLATLNQNSEVVIFKSAGISAHQILSPLVIAALGISVVNFAFNERVTVRANAALDVWQAAEYKRGPAGDATVAEQWVRGGDDLFHADTVSGGGGTTTLHGVTIYDRSGNRLVRVVRATSAVPATGGWTLTGARSFDVARGVETANAQLAFPSAVTAQQFTTVSVDPSHVPFWDLIDEIGEQRDAGRNVDALVASANHKISGPLSAMLMPLLGAVAAFGLARSGRLFVRAVIGMFLGFAFFVADNFMSAMGNFGTVPPVLAAWAPFVLFFLIGETVLFRTEE
ncbi:LPS export ABC transporter permease LptG [Glacieibacterium sp.]|uniref:LPS export ABC transporter permease LptG n=1 Tax=Glacieibacterium sp. TaxID=2860237 RepID=UPI003AFF6652